ncbi:MAG: sigma-70 family RNA polymerase sigma factor [Candidatus Omnitrophica bacterium]|nr:sigma-70 family RNA polymerase sigma factor [Candidatus Omnitrophota bacterium]
MEGEQKVDFHELAKDITPVLKRITYRLGAHHGSFGADDLFQEAFIHLWNNFQEGELSDKTRSYILQGCYYHLKNYLRTHRSRVRELSLQDVVYPDSPTRLEELFLQDDDSGDWRNTYNDRLLAETICNNGLTLKEKEILGYCAQGLTTRQIGSRLKISHVMVGKHLKTIRGKCLKYLD